MKKLPANTIKEKDPERYKAIIGLLKEGVALKVIARTVGTSTSTLHRLMEQDEELRLSHGGLMAKLRKHAHHALDRMNEQLEENPESVGYKDVAVGMGIAADKLEKLSAAQVPHTVNVTQVNVTEAASINDLIASLPTAKPADPPNGAEVVDVEEVKPESADQ